MTMIELCVVMGIVTVLMAMVVGLSRHVSEIVKIRRAQADLGAWHEAFNQWYLQFGEYPYGNPLNNNLLSAATPTRNLRSILDACYVTVGSSNIYFRALTQGYASRTNDPWGSPYIYDCDPGGKSYLLYSCGPDSRSVLNGQGIPDASDPAYTRDDIYLLR